MSFPDLSDAVHPSSSSTSSSSSASTSAAASPTPLADGEYGIANPNYPGFEHLAAKLLKLAAGSDCEDDDDDEENNNNNNNNRTANFNNNINNLEDDSKFDLVNQDRLGCSKKALYDKPKLAAAMADAFLSSAKEDLTISRDFLSAKLPSKMAHGAAHAAHAKMENDVPARKKDSNRAVEEMELDEEEKFSKEATEKEQDAVLAVRAAPRKKEKMAMNLRRARGVSLSDRTERRLSMAGHAGMVHHHGLSHAAAGQKKRSSLEIQGDSLFTGCTVKEKARQAP